MSESEYRDAREAARARVASLEAELRDHDASIEAAAKPPPSNLAEEKRKLRARLRRIDTSRTVVRLIVALIFLSIARHSLVSGSAAGILAVFIVATILLTIRFRGHQPRGEELQLEKRLREIIQIEDDEFARFRVKTSGDRKRVDDKKNERVRIERELEDARAMTQDEAAKNETKKN